MSGARRYGIVCLIVSVGSVVVLGAFGVFLIENAMGMNAIRSRSVIFEKDFDGIAHFPIKNGTKNSQILLIRGTCHQPIEFRVGVLAIDCFLVDSSDAVWARFHIVFLK